MAGTLCPWPWPHSLDTNADPYMSAKLFTYAAGTTTKLATYTDAALSVAHSNPIILTAAGLPPSAIYLSAAAYKLVLAPATDTDPPTSAIRTQDNVLPHLAYNASVGSGGSSALCQGRLSLTSGTPVTTADVSGATNAYWNPYGGYEIGLYDGAAWNTRTFSPITISLAGLTASLPYDIFAYDNSGVVTIEAPTAWTNATTRATALTTQDGVYVKSGALTRRYLGTIYINSSGGQSDDTAAKRYVWNYYNRVLRHMRALEATNSWTYTIDTWRQANGAATNQLDVVVGVAEVEVDVRVWVSVANSVAGTNFYVAIGEDSTTTPSANCLRHFAASPVTGQRVSLVSELVTMPAIGRHTFVWLEDSEASGTTTWYGDNGAAYAQSGMHGSITG